MKRREFIKTAGLSLLAVPAVLYGVVRPATLDRGEAPASLNKGISKWLTLASYRKGHARGIWILHHKQLEPALGQLIDINGAMYTIIEIQPITFGRMSVILLDRPLEESIKHDEFVTGLAVWSTPAIPQRRSPISACFENHGP